MSSHLRGASDGTEQSHLVIRVIKLHEKEFRDKDFISINSLQVGET